MKRTAIVFALFLSASLNAQAPEPVPLAHGNVPGEPHHHLKIENEYVHVYYVEVPPHENTQLHQHDHDYLFVSLGPADVINAVRDKPEVHLVLKDGETHFTRGGFAHVARNLSDAPFRNVTIELLHPQSDPHNLCEKIIDGPLNDCPPPTPNPRIIDWSPKEARGGFAMKGLLKTDQTIVTSISIASKTGPRVDVFPQPPRLLVPLEGSKLQLDIPGKAATVLNGGDVFWLSSGLESVKMTNLLEHGDSHVLALIFWDKDRGKQ
jgi:hypothetical protein